MILSVSVRMLHNECTLEQSHFGVRRLGIVILPSFVLARDQQSVLDKCESRLNYNLSLGEASDLSLTGRTIQNAQRNPHYRLNPVPCKCLSLLPASSAFDANGSSLSGA